VTWLFRWLLLVLLRTGLVVAFPLVLVWTLAERWWSETRSMLFLMRCDVLEGVHYFRQGWQMVRVAARLDHEGRRDA